jgi:hypothetical protein
VITPLGAFCYGTETPQQLGLCRLREKGGEGGGREDLIYKSKYGSWALSRCTESIKEKGGEEGGGRGVEGDAQLRREENKKKRGKKWGAAARSMSHASQGEVKKSIERREKSEQRKAKEEERKEKGAE